MRPPWFAERLLDSFIVAPEVSEDMLGDLTEEWHHRSESLGPRAASLGRIDDILCRLGHEHAGNGGGDGGETLPLNRTAPAVWAARALIASFVCGFSGGFLLCLLSRVAGMVRVTLLAASWLSYALALQVFAAKGWPEWYGITLPVVLILSTFAGGIGAVALRRSERRPPAHGVTRML
jgi:hypothetical protein